MTGVRKYINLEKMFWGNADFCLFVKKLNIVSLIKENPFN